MITAQKLIRAEVWSAPVAAGGTRLAILTSLSRLQGTAQLAGDHVLEGTIALDSAAVPELLTHRILRVDDGVNFDEWVISSVKKNSITGWTDFVAAPLSNLLGFRALVNQVDSTGAVRFNFDLVGLTLAQIIDGYVLPALTAAGVNWVARGTIDQDVTTDVTFDWDTPLSVVKTLASRQGLEFQFRRNGTVGYYIDLLNSIGSAAGVVDVRYAKNLLNHEQQRVIDQQVTRVFPRGMDEEGYRATMARATWRVASVVGNVLGLADPLGGDGPIQFNSQLVGNYLRTSAGALTAVTASSASAQTVTVASAAGIAVNDLIQFRLNSAGHDLTYLTSPADEAGDAKTVVGALDLPDVPSTNNVIPNPALRSWASGMPVGWAKVGAPTVTQQIAAPFVRTAGSSARVQAAADGEGLITTGGKVFPVSNAPYISGYSSFWVVSGKVRVELVLTHAGGSVVIPIPPQYATSDKLGEWVDVGVSAYNAYTPNVITAVAVRIVAHQGAAEFYVDAAQATETAGHKPFVEGSGGTRLWQLANEKLRLYSGVFVTEAIDAVDLYRLDGTTWAESKVELGAQIRVTDARINAAAYQTRIVSFTRDYLTDGAMSVTLSTRPEDLTGSLAKPPRPARLTLTTSGDTGDGTGPSILASSIETDFDVTVNFLISAISAWYTVDDGPDIPLAVGSGQLVISRNTPGGLAKKYVLTAERASQQFSYPVEVAPMTVDPGYLSPTGSVIKADKLTTPRTIWGQSFDGTANVSGAFSGATTGAFSGAVTAGSILTNLFAPSGAGTVTMRGGTTGWRVRNNADTFDNLLVEDDGDAIARGNVTAPDFILGSGGGGSPPPPGSPVAVYDNLTELTTDVLRLTFTGPGVTLTEPTPNHITIDVVGAVASVFGRTGAVVAQTGDYTFAQIGSKPTTIGGYGITDFNSLGDARWGQLGFANHWTALQSFRHASSAAAVVAQMYVSGDTHARLLISAGGTLSWGPGGAVVNDTNLYRSTANVLKTDDNFDALALRVGGTEIVTSARVLQNITASAALLTSGELADARLSSNVPLLNLANTFSQKQTFSAQVGLEFGVNHGTFGYTSFHDAIIWSNNLRYIGTGDPTLPANLTYMRAAGANNIAGAVIMLKGNGGESGVEFEIVTAPTSTGAGVAPVTLTRRFAVFGSGTVHVPGTLQIGDDTVLYRLSANILKTDDTFDAAILHIGGTQVISSSRVLAGVTANADILTSGTLIDARLSANVAMRNTSNIFTGSLTLDGTAGSRSIVMTTVAGSTGTGSLNRWTSDTTYWHDVVRHTAYATSAEQNQRKLFYFDGTTFQLFITYNWTGTPHIRLERELYMGATSILTTGRVLQNVTANASIINAGTLADARLSANVPLLSLANTFLQQVSAPDFVLDGTPGVPGNPGSPVAVYDNAVELTTDVLRLTFTGPGVTLTEPVANQVTVNITGAVASVFGRTGAVVAQSNDYTFAQIGSKPTTIAGFGITDFNSLGDARWGRLAANNSWTGQQTFTNGNPIIIQPGGGTDTAIVRYVLLDGDLDRKTVEVYAYLSSGATGQARLRINTRNDAGVFGTEIITFDQDFVNVGVGFRVGGTEIVTVSRVLQNVTANTSILSAGTLGVARGGTGLATITANNLIAGNGTGAVLLIAPGVTGGYLRSNGTTWSRSDLLATDLTGTIADARLSANVAMRNAANTLTGMLTVTTSDQTTSRLHLINTGTGGKNIALVAGDVNVDNSGVTLWNQTDGIKLLRIASAGDAVFVGTIRSTSTFGLALGSIAGVPRLQFGAVAGTFQLLTSSDTEAPLRISALDVYGLTHGVVNIKPTGSANSSLINFVDSTGVTRIQMGYTESTGLWSMGSDLTTIITFARSTGFATFSSGISASGRISNTLAVAEDNNAAFANTSSTGYGLYSRGGGASRYLFHFTDYADTSIARLYPDRMELTSANGYVGQRFLLSPNGSLGSYRWEHQLNGDNYEVRSASYGVALTVNYTTGKITAPDFVLA